MTPTVILRRWRVRVGDRVEDGQVIGEAESDRLIVDLFADQAGVVAELLFREGDRIEPGKELARIEPAAP